MVPPIDVKSLTGSRAACRYPSTGKRQMSGWSTVLVREVPRIGVVDDARPVRGTHADRVLHRDWCEQRLCAFSVEGKRLGGQRVTAEWKGPTHAAYPGSAARSSVHTRQHMRCMQVRLGVVEHAM